MAKSKQQKRRKQQRRAANFYEAMPATMAVSNFPMAMPQAKPAEPRDPWLVPGDFGRFGRAALADTATILDGARRAIFRRRVMSILLAVIGIGAIAAVVVGANMATSTYNLYGHDLSSPAALLNKKKTAITILDRNGKELYRGDGAHSDGSVTMSDVPASLKAATLAAEDPSFYDHPGFSWKGLARAAWVDVTHGSTAEGGSTLTQQLVKTTLLTSNKTLERKFQELVLSMQLEQKYSKDQIFEMYLNGVYYGQGSTGVATAAQTYFHKSVKDLTLAESALLAGLPLGPSRLDPTLHPQAATDRRNYVLERMGALGMITAAQAKAAEATPMTASERVVDIKAPHFVFYVLDQLRAEYGDELVDTGGITVTTTLDLDKQNQAQQIVSDQIAKLSYHHVTNGGLVSVIPSTGDIISMVGSIGYDTPGFGNVNVTLANLQPGSSFKPIVYLAAFQKGWNGASMLYDKPLHIPNGDGTVYSPVNYVLRFRGPVTVRRALQNSLNIPAIETLQFVGIPTAIEQAKTLGITTLEDSSNYGLSLVLGSGGVRVIDMATVYATFANQGVKVPARAIIKVSDKYGNDITKAADKPAPIRVVDPKYTGMLTNILSDNVARTEEFGANSPLKLSRPAAAKTGTTNDFRDNWTVGYTPSLVTAVWVGNNDHSAMQGVDGITGAAPIWHDYMEYALAGTPVEQFILPDGLQQVRVCGADGGIVGDGQPGYLEVAPLSAPITKPCTTGLPSPTPSPSSGGATPSPTASPAAFLRNRGGGRGRLAAAY